MPSGLEFNEKPGYIRREIYQSFLDWNRGGGLISGESDLTLQIILGNMDLCSNPTDERLKQELKRFYTLQNICEEMDGYHLEARLDTPEDIYKALEMHQI